MNTYFVETHEFDTRTCELTLLEYVLYSPYETLAGSEIESMSHHTILQLAIF